MLITRKIFRNFIKWTILTILSPLWLPVWLFNRLAKYGRTARILRFLLILPFLPIYLVIYCIWRRNKVARWLMLIGIGKPKTSQDLLDRSLVSLSIGNWTGGARISTILYRFVLHKLGIKSMHTFLKDHSQQIVDEMGDQFFLRVAKMDDRSLALISTSLLERWMGLSILTRFGLLKDKDQYDRAFGPNGPLAGMSAKITMCSVLGILVGDMAHDLTLLKNIRNRFAHELKELTFLEKKPPIENWSLSLKMSGSLSEEIRTAAGNRARIRFLESTQAIVVYLSVLTIRNATANVELLKMNTEIHRQVREIMAGIHESAKAKSAANGG